MKTGVIRHVDENKKFGFIRGDDGEDYLFHGGSFSPQLQRLSSLIREGYRVKFDTDFDMKGNKAINIHPE